MGESLHRKMKNIWLINACEAQHWLETVKRMQNKVFTTVGFSSVNKCPCLSVLRGGPKSLSALSFNALIIPILRVSWVRCGT